MPATIPLGRFAWHELRTTDADAAKRFYPTFMGWTTAPWEDDSYALWMNGAVPAGGLMQLTAEMVASGVRSCWMPFMSTPECDATVAHLTALGGTIQMAPWDIPAVGRVAMVADPQGAEFGLYTPLEADPTLDAPPEPGQFSWHELSTTDPDGALTFYLALFGWDKLGEFDMGAMGIYHLLGYGGAQRIGLMRQSDESLGSHWLPYAMVPDADAAFATATEHGAGTMVAPMEVPGGDRVSLMRDPQGVAFAVHAAKR